MSWVWVIHKRLNVNWKKIHPIILSVTCHCLRNFPHSYTSPHIHSWIFKMLWVIISWVWVILKIWCHKHGWVGHAGIEWVIQGWHMSCRDETGWVISGWGRWELQGTESRNATGYQIWQNNNGNAGYWISNTKILKVLSYWCYRVYH